MAYALNDLITTAEFNGFANQVNAVWGIGTGDSGYGQTSTVSTVVAGNDVTATQWSTLLARGNSAAGHQGTAWSSGTNVTAGNPIQVISSLAANCTSINTNRLTAAVVNTTTGALASPTSSALWTTQSQLIYTLTWADQDAARAFFNSGGQVQMAFSRSGGSAHAKNTGWTSLCTAAGTIVFAAHSTTKTGGSGSPTILLTTTGYYEGTTSDVNLFRQFDTTSPYTANYLNVAVRTNTITDPNSRGGRGNVLTFTVTFRDDATDTSIPSSIDVVDGTFTASINSRRANTNFLNSPQPANPTYALTSWSTS
ncbi:MAG: hypothetical protein H9535_00525 [Ignavibacteria bacterium]|nr:hypothetical protein [Ignavibacteria bacterium]